MRILPIIDQIKTNCALLSNRVEPAQSLMALNDDEVVSNLPIVFVYPGKESGSENHLSNATSQTVPLNVVCLIAAANSNGTYEPMEDVRDQIKAALVGYQVSETHYPMRFVEGESLEISKRIIWWRDVYQTKVTLRNV